MTIQQAEDRLKELKVKNTGNFTSQTRARIGGRFPLIQNRKTKHDWKQEFITISRINDASAERIMKSLSPITHDDTNFTQKTHIRTDHYLYFFRRTDIHCPPVAAWLETADIPGIAIDIDMDGGRLKAKKYGVVSSPTVIFFDTEGRERGRGNDLDSLEEILESSQ